MGTALLLITVLVAVAAGLYLWKRRANHGGRPAAGPPNTAAARALEAAAVHTTERRPGRMINVGSECCRAATKIQSTWFAEGSAPVLPLEQCENAPACRCNWMRVLDRRVTHRRVSPDRRAQLRFEERNDRRNPGDRRGKSPDVWRNAG
jgi:hypothetical protein